MDLTAAIAALTTRIGNLHPVVLELQGWKPTIKKSMEELSRDVNDMHTQISDEAPHGGKVKDAVTLPVCLADLPPLLPRLANTPHPHQGNLLPIRGDDGHRPQGHSAATDFWGKSLGQIHTPMITFGHWYL
ncbi:hypothetical protein ZWY2020_038421 [Hordeum vulgare]|nr:hypothetical protein ZWY2020_038421 [Hordeum vulgare]